MKSVDAGAALLDERLPGWRTAIDPDTLELRYCTKCVLGQIFGRYDDGLALLGLTKKEAEEYGFYRRPRGAWETLTAAWLKKVRRR